MGRKSLSERDEPLVIGHRGAAATHPENTLASFEAAFQAGADAVEADIRLTADGVAVVIHDADVSRTTDGAGLVHELTLEQVRAFDAGSGQQVPTLHELLELVADHEAGVALEVKNLPGDPGYDPAHEGAVDALIHEAAEFPAMPILVVSFNPRSVERARRAKDLETGFLATAAMDPRIALRYVVEAGHDWLWPQVGAVLAAGEALPPACHDASVRIGAWTVDEPGDMRSLRSWGIDALVSNDPAAAVTARGNP